MSEYWHEQLEHFVQLNLKSRNKLISTTVNLKYINPKSSEK